MRGTGKEAQCAGSSFSLALWVCSSQSTARYDSRTFRIRDLSRAYGYARTSGAAGRYSAIVSRSGTLVYGRGGVLDTDGLFAAGTLTTGGGRRFRLHIGDLVRNLRDGIRAHPPDSYRAILAPRGRFIFGRSCWPRDWNTNIIGLDRAC